MNISIVIPCYRSEATLKELIPNLLSTLEQLKLNKSISNFEVVLVIDGSPDETAFVANRFGSLHKEIKVIELQRNFGQHNALLAGIRSATGDVIVTMDDDLQHPPTEIQKILAPITTGDADLVYGVAFQEEHGLLRSIASRTVKKGLSLSGVTNAEWVSAFRAFKTSLRTGFQEVNEPTVNLDVILSWTTSRVEAVKVMMDHRMNGSSSYGFVKLMRHTFNMVTGYGVAPLKIATFFGFLVAVFGFVVLAVELIKYFSGQNNVQGFTTTIALVSVFSGVQLITIGLIGEYLGRMYFRTMKKPMYLIKDSDR
jgi:undecaprenyl-phosphate 4-deoxy-4-formamido-L-arabinose transferase